VDWVPRLESGGEEGVVDGSEDVYAVWVAGVTVRRDEDTAAIDEEFEMRKRMNEDRILTILTLRRCAMWRCNCGLC
jgi:hypothetical protein